MIVDSIKRMGRLWYVVDPLDRLMIHKHEESTQERVDADATEEARTMPTLLSPDQKTSSLGQLMKNRDVKEQDSKDDCLVEEQIETEEQADKGLRTFYDDRISDIDMLDGHSDYFRKDPKHSLKLLRTIFKNRKTARRVLEVSAGNGRVSKAVLRHIFKLIDIIEPSVNMRKRAQEEMSQLGRPYGKVFDCTMQQFSADKKGPYDCVWIQFCVMYLNDIEFVEFLTKLRLCLAQEGRIIIKENMSDDKTVEVVGEYKENTDRSLIRSKQCFQYIFAKAGYTVVRSEDWNEVPGMSSIYTAELKVDTNVTCAEADEEAHAGCTGFCYLAPW